MAEEAFDPGQALLAGTKKVTAKWAKQRKAEERSQRASQRRQTIWSSREPNLKSVAWEVISDAWAKASAGNTLPVHWRQCYYAARPLIQAEVTWETLTDTYFKRLFEDYVASHPGETAGWRIIFGPRGSMQEPHGKKEVELGTVGVENYLSEVCRHRVRPVRGFHSLSYAYPTMGPRNRYSALLIIEKEGFNEIFAAAELAERFDLAIANTKGISTKAVRKLASFLQHEHGLPVLVAHDLDKNGFVLAGTFPGARSIGLRLADVELYGLEAEAQEHRNPHKTRLNLLKNGAAPEEADFISSGSRVELNMFTSDKLIEWLSRKLKDHGVEKVIPEEATLEDAYRRVVAIDYLNRRAKDLADEARAEAERATVPDDLVEQVRAALDEDPSRTWDDALALVVGVDESEDEEDDEDEEV